MKTFQERLKEARIKKGLSQGQLAKACGVSQGTIANLESGYRKQPRSIIEIARALGVDAEWLATGRLTSCTSDNLVNLQQAREEKSFEWPLVNITEGQWNLLSPMERGAIEGFALSYIKTAEETAKKNRIAASKTTAKIYILHNHDFNEHAIYF